MFTEIERRKFLDANEALTRVGYVYGGEPETVI